MIGLSGAHRTGKTTLAKALALKCGVKFVETSASSVFAELGLDPAKTYDFSTRLTVQEAILDRFDKIYGENVVHDCICDRTPLDLLGYTLAEAIGNVVTPEDQARLNKYVERCFDVANKRFSTFIIVQPGIPLIEEEGKAALNSAYIEHLNSLILGLSVDERLKATHFYLPRRLTDLQDRIAAVENAVALTLRRYMSERDSEGHYIQ